MATTIVTKNGTGAPTDSDLVAGELAVDLTNGRLYTTDLDTGGTVIEIGLNPSGNLDVTGSVTADGLTVDGTTSVTQSSNAATALTSFTNSNAGTSSRASISFASDTGSSVVGTVSSGWTVDALNANETFVYGSNGVSLFAPASQDVRILAGGSEKLVVKSSGNVGIGTSSPSYKLDVQGTARVTTGSTGTPFIVESGGTSQGNIRFGSTSGAYEIYGGADYLSMQFHTGGTERMRIDSSGNVGIGVSNPSSYSANADNLVVGGEANVGMHFDSNSSTGNGGIYFSDQASVRGILAYSHTDDAMQFFTNGTTERMRIDSSGNLLVGLTTGGKFSVSYGGNDTHFGLGANYDNYITAGSSGVTIFRNASTERMRIDASGNVGIGDNTFAAGKLQVYDSAGNHVWLKGRASDGTSSVSFRNNADNAYNGRIQVADTGGMLFQVAGSTRATIDASGNLLVGTTTVNGEGITLGGTNNYGYFSRASSPAFFVNRNTNDGALIELRKADVAVGSIGTQSSVAYMMFYPSTGLRGGSASIVPATTDGAVSDNAKDWGSATVRWDDIYATNGTIQTSDANEKQDIEELSEAEQRVAVAAKGLLRKFRWKDSVAEKGDEARIHFGIIAQDLQAAFEAEGLDAGDYAMFIHSTWTDEETGEERSRMGVRYSELLAFIIAAI